MPVAVAVWSIAIRPGEPEPVIPQADVRITNVALGDELQDETGRTTVKLIYARPVEVDGDDGEDDEDDEEDENKSSLATTVLCSLIPGKIEQSTIDVTLEADEEFLFQAVGKNTVYLTGNYIDQSPANVPYNSDEEPDSDEEGFDLRDVSSDVEIDPGELDIPSDDESRFEEVQEEPPKSLKRPRGSDAAMDTDEPADAKLTKSQKKANKKLKAESGVAVPAESDGKKTDPKGETKKDKKEKEKGKKDKKEKGDSMDVVEASETGGLKEMASGLKVKDVKIGAGPQAKKGNTVSMRYIGKLQNGKVFDKNTKGKPFSFHLGKGEVIKGWDEGILGMQAGGERLLIVPPKMAYGSSKSGPIPANSTLTFECKLLDLK